MSWKKNLAAFAEMDSISDQVRFPSTHFYHSTTFRNRSHAFKSCDYKVCSRFTMPALLFVMGLKEELIKHFCQVEDMTEHIEDKYGRVLTAGDVEHYIFEMISDWYPKFNELYDFWLTTTKLHISTSFHGKKYATSSKAFPFFNFKQRRKTIASKYGIAS